MTPKLRTLPLFLALALPVLAGCQREPEPAVADEEPATATASPENPPETLIGRTVEKALREARRELETGNIDLEDGIDITVGDGDRKFRIGGPAGSNPNGAQITPQGELLVDGKAVEITPEQRALLLEYRGHIVEIARAGMALGVKGADLAGKAMLETLSGLLRGNADEAGRRLDAEGKRLEAEAAQLCRLLPAMLATQDKLAASLPAFRPYARMTQEDVDDCGREMRESMRASGEATREEIRETIRETVRGSVREDDAAAEAETAR